MCYFYIRLVKLASLCVLKWPFKYFYIWKLKKFIDIFRIKPLQYLRIVRVFFNFLQRNLTKVFGVEERKFISCRTQTAKRLALETRAVFLSCFISFYGHFSVFKTGFYSSDFTVWFLQFDFTIWFLQFLTVWFLQKLNLGNVPSSWACNVK